MSDTVKWGIALTITLLVAMTGSTYVLFGVIQSGQQATNDHLIAITDRLATVETEVQSLKTDMGWLRANVATGDEDR